MDASENRTSNPRITAGVRSINDMIEERLSRRCFLGGLGAAATTASLGCATVPQTLPKARAASEFSFAEITRGADGNHHTPKGYSADLVLRWGDAVFYDAPPFNPLRQTAAAQERQFGYNNDFIGYYPIETNAADDKRGLLCVNHEYTSTALMFPGLSGMRIPSREICEVEMAAHGGTIIEIEQDGAGVWRPVLQSQYNRRITAGSTPITLSGPAAGAD
ncbi:MAG: PhoX family protein, partial [Hyphococcus sp.]